MWGDVLKVFEFASISLFLTAGPIAVMRARRHPRRAVRVLVATIAATYLVDGVICWYWLVMAPSQDILFYPWWPQIILSLIVAGPVTVTIVELARTLLQNTIAKS